MCELANLAAGPARASRELFFVLRALARGLAGPRLGV